MIDSAVYCRDTIKSCRVRERPSLLPLPTNPFSLLLIFCRRCRLLLRKLQRRSSHYGFGRQRHSGNVCSWATPFCDNVEYCGHQQQSIRVLDHLQGEPRLRESDGPSRALFGESGRQGCCCVKCLYRGNVFQVGGQDGSSGMAVSQVILGRGI